MKFSALIIPVAASVLLIASCSKDTSNGGAASGPRPKKYIEDITSVQLGNSVTTYDLSYDGSNRLSSFVSEAPGGLRQLFQYNGASSYSMDLYDGAVLSIHENFFINSNSFVDSTIQYNDTDDTTTERYLYNQAGQLITVKEYDYSASIATLSNLTTYTYNSAGDPVTQTDDNGTNTFTYYDDLTNNLLYGQPYFQQTKRLVKTVTNNQISVSHTYSFDSGNRLVVDSAVGSNGDIIKKTYVY